MYTNKHPLWVFLVFALVVKWIPARHSQSLSLLCIFAPVVQWIEQFRPKE